MYRMCLIKLCCKLPPKPRQNNPRRVATAWFASLAGLVSLTGCGPAELAAPECRSEAVVAVTAAHGACLIVANQQVLLVADDNGRWQLPQAEAGALETSACAAHRATWQATGINVKVTQQLGWLTPTTMLYHCTSDAGIARLPQSFTYNDQKMKKADIYQLSHRDLTYPDHLVPLRDGFVQATQPTR